MSDQIYGIDLGTTYSCIAKVNEHGLPEVILNADNDPTTPSVVFFESPGSVVVGSTAKESVDQPNLVASLVKREMGNPDWAFPAHGNEFKAPAVSAEILRHIVDYAAQAGEDVKRAIITVPAYFTMTQRQDTRIAGQIAGLEVEEVLNEPTAAAFSYGLGSDAAQGETVLVYDLGGGTFDVTVIGLRDDRLDVVATGGDPRLGGADWDQVLVELLASRFADAHPGDDPADSDHAMAELRVRAEDTKKKLTSRESIAVPISYEGTTERIEVTRAEFDERTRHLLDQTLEKTQQILDEAREKGVTHIDRVLLVGGSSRMPQVAAALTERFGIETKLQDPDLAVAKGAALYGASKRLRELAADPDTPDDDLPTLPAPVTISNVTSHGFGIVAYDRDDTERVFFLVERNTNLPHEVSQEFATRDDGQTYVAIQLAEQPGESLSREVADNDIVVERDLGPLPPSPKGTPVGISMTINNDGLLTVVATCRGERLEFDYSIIKSTMTEDEAAQAARLSKSMTLTA